MVTIPRMTRAERRRLIRGATKSGDPGVIRRAQVVASAAGGYSAPETAQMLVCATSFVYKTLLAFVAQGWFALLDGRSGNGNLKADANFRRVVRNLLDRSPRDYGFVRPTWTRELLVLVAEEETSVRVSVCVMGRTLRAVGARRGRPKPIVDGTLGERQQRRRLAAIRKLIAELPQNEVAVYEDEVDIHLNPKIGLDWMNQGVQKTVMTPGKNEKAYLAGTLDARDGTLLWVGGTAKNGGLFVKMLEKLDSHYASAKRIHVILDNYGIHKSGEVDQALERLPRIRLHFLPPYCPDYNRIERVWLDLHANVTRNHKHSELIPLCQDVAAYLNYTSPWTSDANHERPPLRVALRQALQ